MNNSMVDDNLRERRSHGSLLFPFSIYHTEQSGEQNVMLYKHWHEEAEILFVTKGEMEVITENFSDIINKNVMLFLPPNSLHGAYHVKNMPCSFTSIVFHLNFIHSYTNDRIQQQLLNPLFHSKQAYIVNVEEIKEKVYPILQGISASFVEMTEEDELYIKGLLLQLLYYFIKSPPKTLFIPRRLEQNIERQKKILDYIDANYASPLTLDELSSVLYLSKEQFCRFFKENFRDTPINFLKKYRIHRSVELLLTTDKKITDIAYEVGFDSSNYFTIVFKSVLNLSPRNFRKEQKQSKSYQARKT